MGEPIFAGLRVIDFSEGMAGPMAAMLLADNGADVVKVEGPSGDCARSNPGFRMWNRGKRSVVVDFERSTDRKIAQSLAVSADIVIHSFRHDRAVAYGLDQQTLARMNPRLISASIGGFGLASEWDDLPWRDEIVAAKSGRFNGNDMLSGAHFDGRPVYIVSPFSSFCAAGLAVQAICAALLVRNRTGHGQHIETSLLDGAITGTMRLAFKREGDRVIPSSERDASSALITRGIMLCFMTAECSDGNFIQMCARQDLHFRNWFKCMGLGGTLEDERYRGAPIGLKSLDALEELEKLIRQTMKSRTVDDWMRLFMDFEVGADPFLKPSEFLRHPQMVLNDRIVELADPQVGMVRQIGKLAEFSDTPSRISRGAPMLGQHQPDLEALLSLPGDPPGVESRAAVESKLEPPLKGTTIIELATYVAGPVGGALLAELGARVIKIEPVGGDAIRRVGLEVVHIVRGKESIVVDLKTQEGQALLHRLVEKADGLLHNSRTGAVDRIAADYATLSAINPRLVYVAASAYGSKGPEAYRPAFHSTPHALSGAGILQAGEGNPPVDDSYPDPCAGVGAATAMMMGLVARERTGKGQYVETTMLTCTGYVHSAMLTEFEGGKKIGALDHGQFGFSPVDRLYQCSDGWLFLSVRAEAEWHAMRGLAGLDDVAWEFVAGNQADSRLSNVLGLLFAQKPASEWEDNLAALGISAIAVSSSFEAFMVENHVVRPAEHPRFGTYYEYPPRMRFSKSAESLGAPCVAGEHTGSILEELGYSTESISSLIESGIVMSAAG